MDKAYTGIHISDSEKPGRMATLRVDAQFIIYAIIDVHPLAERFTVRGEKFASIRRG